MDPKELLKKKKEEQLKNKQYIGKLADFNDEERSFVITISTEDVDRMGESVRARGIKLANYRKNPVVLWAHDYSSPPIAKALWTKVMDSALKSKVQFASTQFAEEIFGLYKGGFLNAWSIGFIPNMDKIDIDEEADGKANPKLTFKESELLEYSAVPVPANPNALNDAVKRGILKTKSVIDALQVNKEPEKTLLPLEQRKEIYKKYQTKKLEFECEKCGETIEYEKGTEEITCPKCGTLLVYSILLDLFCSIPEKKEEETGTKKEAEPKAEEKKKSYDCECVDCGHKETYDDHCKKHKCPECDGTMRRVERPGPGEKVEEPGKTLTEENMSAIVEEVLNSDGLKTGVSAMVTEAINIEKEEPAKVEEPKEAEIQILRPKEETVNKDTVARMDSKIDNFIESVDKTLRTITGKVS